MSTTYELEGRLTTAVRRIRGLWPLVMLETKTVSTGPAGSDSVTGLDRRLSLLGEVTASLNGWARVIVEDRDIHHWVPAGHDIAGLCMFIERHAQWFSGHEAAETALEELLDWETEMRRVALPEVRDWMVIGDCPFVVGPDGNAQPDDGDVTRSCGGVVRGYGDDRDPHCTRCKQTAVVEWWVSVFESALPETVSAAKLAELVHSNFGRPAKAATVRQWVARKWIEPAACALDDRSLVFDTHATIKTLSERWDRTA